MPLRFWIRLGNIITMSQNPTSTEETNEQADTAAPKNGSGQSVPFRNPKKSKPTHVLPSDRLSTDKQLEALRAFVVASEAENGAVTNDQAGKIVGMSALTVVVTNAFFTDIGLLARSDSGQFMPSQAAKEYQAAYAWDATTSAAKLAPAFRDTWFAKALLPRLKMRSFTKAEALAFLAEACKASPEYQSRLVMILEFLNASGLLSLAGDEVKATSGTSSVSGGPTGGGAGGNDEPPKPPSTPVGDTIPADAPFIYADPEKKKKIVLIAPSFSVTSKEFERVKKWFELQFFITDENADGKGNAA
jgi:hypothetical protein